MKTLPLPLAVILAGFALLTETQAAVVFSEDFTGDTSLSSAFTVGSGAGVTVGVSTDQGNPAPSLTIADASTANSGSATVYGNNWSAFNTATGSNKVFEVAFDWRIDSSISSSASTLRFNVSLGGTTATTVNIGFGHAVIGGTDTNILYAAGGTSGATPSSSNAIGYTGSSFLSGFNFGAYSSSTATNNSTGGDYYHFTLTYVDQATSAQLNVYNISDPSQTATVTISGITATSVANTSGRYIQSLSGQSGTGVSYVDNIVVSVIPEPSTTALAVAGAALGLFLVRRRR
ncbi:MAG: PEP-CTERM sorting domain-containing protein [Verrucomicrobia bacterium]|nr:PEP-CTERM sorting domain-containing protein [Verrucomicrobiota bacterium]